MKILITGVAGFIGSNLAKYLLKKNYTVYGIDNFSHGFLRNINPFLKNKNFKFFFCDLTRDVLPEIPETDIVVHLASQKIPRYSNALITLEENTLMLKNIVKKCIKNKTKIIFASTSDVYGKNNKLPFTESSDLVLGQTTIKRWAYALTKIYGEQYIIANSDEYGLKYSILRFFGSYGPNQNPGWWGGPQSVFINNALKKIPLEIHGNGCQSRTFTYIDDTVDAIIRCIENNKSDNQIFNVGSEPENEISIIELAKLIWQIINGIKSKPLLNFIPYSNFGRYEDVNRRLPDITKIKSILGFKPKTELIEGLKKTINWQKKINT